MANNLKDHLKEVADAIRAKKGTSDLINPQDFATEIEGITSGSGGGEDSGGVEYCDISGEGFEGYAELAVAASTIKLLLDDGTYAYGPPMMWLISGTELDATKLMQVKAFAMDPTTPLYGGVFTSPTPVGELYGKEAWDKMPKITKEEFYNALP